MKRVELSPDHGFRVIAGTQRSQAATMVLDPHDDTGGPDNRHSDSDQWLLVIAGAGEATVNGEAVALQPGTLLLIEAGEAHEIRNTGTRPLETLNFYAAPAY